METTAHWTEGSVDAFYQRIIFDFITQIQKRLEAKPVKQVDLAERLGVTEGRVSQILNNPGDVVSLKKAIKLARAVGMKLALVAYDDNDPDNERGPVNSDIFRITWENAGRPRTFRYLHRQPIDSALTGEVKLVEAGRRGFYLVGRDAYANRPKASSAYARALSALQQPANPEPSQGANRSLLLPPQGTVITPYLQGE